jgi:putative hydrolase of the HAD superfamily
MGNNIRSLLFDLGNVLVDIDIDGAHERLNQLLRIDAQRPVIEKAFIDYECGRITTDIFINTLLSQSELKVQALDIIEAWNSMIVGIPDYRVEMLRQLRKKYTVYVLSNTNALHLEWIHRYVRRVHKVEAFEKELLDHAFYSHLVGDRKPNASLFKFITEDSFMTPALTLYMDDVQENLNVAARLGFNTHLVKPGDEIAEYLKQQGYF